MGNCLVTQENITRILKPDGEILKYKASVTVGQVLSEFSGHAISETLQVGHSQHLQPDTKLHHGQLYYLVPAPLIPAKERKKVRFSIPEAEPEQGTSAVRIKLVISKKELNEMLTKGGFSFDEIVFRAQTGERVNSVDSSNGADDCQEWKPVLGSISEVN